MPVMIHGNKYATVGERINQIHKDDALRSVETKILSSLDATAGQNAVLFYRSASLVGSITTTAAATAYNTSSDYRLKNSITPMYSGLATIGALKPVTYKWNVDNSDGEGFIAHELQEVIPHAVVGVKDAVNEDGSIKPQAVDYSKIVVHLVAALQEASAKIDALENRIATLENNK